jgi:basic membrane protein A
MPFLQAGTLAKLLQGQPLPLPEIRRLILQLGEALDYAHSHGLVHRDVKPSNVLLDERGNCLLTDFGIARLVEATSKFTATGAVLGTPSYMSPEQAKGDRVDHRSDIYSLGVILYELATGRVPFRAETPLAVLMKHIHDPLPPPRSLNPDLSEALERIILKAMAKDPDDRFGSAGDMVRAVQDLAVLAPPRRAESSGALERTAADSGQASSPPQPRAPSMRAPRRTRIPVVAALGAGVLTVALMALVAILARGNDQDQRAGALPASTSQVSSAPTRQALPATATRAVFPEILVCQVTDTGGIDDKSFNATAWKGVEGAVDQLGIEGKFLESQQQTDYATNINAFLEEGCDLIITVGFLLGTDTQAAAEANPDAKFTIVDFAYDPTIPNVLGQVFNTNEAAFLAGYVAAATTQTGTVGTFGGIQIPPVTVFMDGFALGVDYYNQQKGTSVEVLGWDPAAQERGGVYIVGVDNDWAVVNADYAPIILTSVLKNMEVTTMAAIQAAIDGTFAGGVTVGTLENGGVGLAEFHDLASMVSAELQGELDQVRADIIAGSIATLP